MIFLTIDQTAERLQCSTWTVKQMILKGKLHAIRLGGTDNGDYRVSEAALFEFGVGGPRPIVLPGSAQDAVASAYDSVATPTSGDLPRSTTSKRLPRRKANV